MKTLLKLVAIGLLAAAPAFADSVDTFRFNTNIGNIGEIVEFTQGQAVLIISGWETPGDRGPMWMKNLGLDETGVGLASEGAHEIAGSQFVQVNLARILALHPTSITFTMNSIQEGESYDIFGSNVSGLPGTLLAANVSAPDFTVPTNFDFISVGAGEKGNVLLNDISVGFTATPTPEPSTLVLMLIGLVVITVIARRTGAVAQT